MSALLNVAKERFSKFEAVTFFEIVHSLRVTRKRMREKQLANNEL